MQQELMSQELDTPQLPSIYIYLHRFTVCGTTLSCVCVWRGLRIEHGLP